MIDYALDLGCGPNPRNPFAADLVYGVDLQDFGNPLIKVADLAIQPIPFDDNSFDYLTAYDFLEHIPRQLYPVSYTHLTLPTIYSV